VKDLKKTCWFTLLRRNLQNQCAAIDDLSIKWHKRSFQNDSKTDLQLTFGVDKYFMRGDEDICDGTHGRHVRANVERICVLAECRRRRKTRRVRHFRFGHSLGRPSLRVLNLKNRVAHVFDNFQHDVKHIVAR